MGTDESMQAAWTQKTFIELQMSNEPGQEGSTESYGARSTDQEAPVRFPVSPLVSVSGSITMSVFN